MKEKKSYIVVSKLLYIMRFNEKRNAAGKVKQ